MPDITAEAAKEKKKSNVEKSLGKKNGSFQVKQALHHGYHHFTCITSKIRRHREELYLPCQYNAGAVQKNNICRKV